MALPRFLTAVSVNRPERSRNACGRAAEGYGERVAERVAIGLAFIAIGLLVIFNRETQARETVEFQNRWFRFKHGAKEVRINRRIYPVVGAGFIVWGIVYAISGF